jgi:hypothetical protein
MSFLLLRRTPAARGLALLVQVVAVLCQLAEGTGRVHCPHHDLVAGQAMAGMDHGMDHAPGHSHHGTPAGHACTCLGECCMTAGALPSSQLPEFAAAISRLLPTPRTHALPAILLEARQPPSTGPPLST